MIFDWVDNQDQLAANNYGYFQFFKIVTADLTHFSLNKELLLEVFIK